MNRPAMHPDMQAIMAASARTTEQLGPRTADDVAAARRWWTVYTRALSRPPPKDMQVDDRSVPSEDGAVPVRIYRHGGAEGALPCIV